MYVFVSMGTNPGCLQELQRPVLVEPQCSLLIVCGSPTFQSQQNMGVILTSQTDHSITLKVCSNYTSYNHIIIYILQESICIDLIWSIYLMLLQLQGVQLYPFSFSNFLFVNLSSRTKSGCQSFVVFGIHCIVHHLHCITCRFESIGHGFRELGDFLLQWASILPGQISWKEGDQKTHNLQKIQWKLLQLPPKRRGCSKFKTLFHSRVVLVYETGAPKCNQKLWHNDSWKRERQFV